MSISEEEFQLIVKYVEKDLSEHEQILFDKSLDTSPEFKEEVRVMEGLVAGVYANVRTNEFEDIKNAFEKFEEEDKKAETSPTKKGKVINLYKTIGIAASLTLILLVSYFVFFQSKVDHQEVYLSFYEPYPAYNLRSDGENENQGILNYRLNLYEKAIPFLIDALASENNQRYQLLLANAYMNTGAYDKANNILKSLAMDDRDKIMQQNASWYIGLLYLKTGRIEEAKSEFSKLISNGNSYKNQAINILNELE